MALATVPKFQGGTTVKVRKSLPLSAKVRCQQEAERHTQRLLGNPSFLGDLINRDFALHSRCRNN